MKHLNMKRSRFLALLLTSSLVLGLPVMAAEEWDSASALEDFTAAESLEETVQADDLAWFDGEEDLFVSAEEEGALGAAAEESTLKTIGIGLPVSVTTIQALQVGSTIPVTFMTFAPMITLEGKGVTAGGEEADLSDKLTLSDIYWTMTAPVAGEEPEKLTGGEFGEAVYYLCMDLAYTDVTPAADLTAGFIGAEQPLPVCLSEGKVTVYYPHDLSGAKQEDPAQPAVTLTALDLGLAPEYMALLSTTRTVAYGTPTTPLPLTVASVNGVSDEAALAMVTLGQVAYYVWPESGMLGTALQSPAGSAFTEKEYLVAIPLSSQVAIAEDLQVTVASVPGLFSYQSYDGQSGILCAYLKVEGAPAAESTTTAPETEPPVESTTEAKPESTTAAPAPTEATTTAPATTEPTTTAPATTEPTTTAPVIMEPTTIAPVIMEPTTAVEPGTEETTEAPAEGPVSLARPDRPAAKNLKLGIKLTWNAVENAKEYEIFRIRQGEKLKKIGTTEELTFTDEDTYHGVQYIYYVRAKSYTDGDVSYVSEGVSKGQKHVFVKRSDKVKVAKDKMSLSWIGTKDIDGYQILVANNPEMKGGQKFTLPNVTTVSLADIPQVSLLPAGTYYISLRQYLMVEGKRYVSAYHGKKKYVKE